MLILVISFIPYGHDRHSILKLQKVNTYGLLYEWTGSDSSLKPVLLAAHQGLFSLLLPSKLNVFILLVDVVPVDRNTVDQWTHPPFSGHFDGMYIQEYLVEICLIFPDKVREFGDAVLGTTRAALLVFCMLRSSISWRIIPNYFNSRRSAIEPLLEKDFKPIRTFVLAFGFDEEVSGRRVSLFAKHST